MFVLSLLNAAAFAVTGLLLHRLTRGDTRRQQRAALLWTANPLLLQVLVAGAHVDSQAIVFAVAALAVFVPCTQTQRASSRPAWAGRRRGRCPDRPRVRGQGDDGAGRGGLAIACVLAWRAAPAASSHSVASQPMTTAAVVGA